METIPKALVSLCMPKSSTRMTVVRAKLALMKKPYPAWKVAMEGKEEVRGMNVTKSPAMAVMTL